MKNLKIKDLERVNVVFDQIVEVKGTIDKKKLWIEIKKSVMELLSNELCLEIGDRVDLIIDVEKDIWYRVDITNIYWGYFAGNFNIHIEVSVWS